MRIIFSKKFFKQYKKMPIPIQEKFKIKLNNFREGVFTKNLRIHKLHGEFQHMRSVDVTGDIRALFSQRNNEIVFEQIGSHNELY